MARSGSHGSRCALLYSSAIIRVESEKMKVWDISGHCSNRLFVICLSIFFTGSVTFRKIFNPLVLSKFSISVMELEYALEMAKGLRL